MKNLRKYIKHNNLHRTDGHKGVSNLCKLVRALGYRESRHFGQGSTSDLVEFLEDNPGAIEAIIDWIDDNGIEDWDETLEIGEEEDEGTD